MMLKMANTFLGLFAIILYLVNNHLTDGNVINNNEGLSDDYDVVPPAEDYESRRGVRSVAGDGCTYTFQVARTEANSCPPGSSETNNNHVKLEEIQTNMLKYHSAITEKLDDLSNIIQALNIHNNNSGDKPNLSNEEQMNFSHGSTHYTRWGSSTCPDTAELLYTGYAAKSHYTHGGGVNFLCLPEEPEFHEKSGTGYQSQSYIYGVEYERHNSPLIPADRNNNDVPCAVCHVTGRGEQLMIPAKKTCLEGWTQEYDGYLMADKHTHKPSDYICVDKGLEVLFGGSTNANGGLLYMVEAVCGSLKCPPYINGYEILCTVCTL